VVTKADVDQLKRCVCFLFLQQPDGEFKPRGTGFFVGLRAENKERIPSDQPNASGIIHAYLVTARHVLQDKQGNFLKEVFIRMNKLDGASEMLRLSIDELGVYTHNEKEVDLAVIPTRPDPGEFAVAVIQEESLATKEKISEMGIGEGDDVIFVGLFTHHIGKVRNQPILRFGKVALIPEEKVQSNINTLEDLYLMECQSYAANSGSPVFFEISLARRPLFLPQRLFLAGVLKGHFRFDVDTEEPITLGERPNIGIAAVIPSYKLCEILFSPEMRNQRREQENMWFAPGSAHPS
jgi:hypothetical protein